MVGIKGNKNILFYFYFDFSNFRLIHRTTDVGQKRNLKAQLQPKLEQPYSVLQETQRNIKSPSTMIMKSDVVDALLVNETKENLQ